MLKELGSKAAKKRPHEALGDQIARDGAGEAVAGHASKKKAARGGLGGKAAALSGDSLGADDFSDEDAAEAFVPAKTSRRILNEARAQQEEEEEDEAAAGAGGAGDDRRGSKRQVRFHGSSAAAKSGQRNFSDVAPPRDDASSVGDGDMDADDDVIEFADDDDVRLEGDFVDTRGDEDMYGGDEEDAAILKRFMPDAPAERRTLADIIMEKLREVEEGKAGAPGDLGPAQPALDPKVVEVYTDVGRYLAHYKTGKLPKVFKVVPALSNWEEVLFLTNPETWTPHATYAATRVFASNFNPAKAQRFYNLVLLPKCRDDIAFHKRLNFHLYLALRKATYKPAAFYKGILLPLAASGDCGVKEAVIFGSILGKSSIPQLHSAAALIKLAGMRYCGPVSVFIRLLVNKKYSLPYMAIDAIVEHFVSFLGVAGPLPVIWHQCLLTVAQRYKAEVTREQKDGLRAVMGVHSHHAITPEIRRELFSCGCRGDSVAAPPQYPSAPPAAPASSAASSSAPRALLVAKKPGSAGAGGRPGTGGRPVPTGDSMDE